MIHMYVFNVLHTKVLLHFSMHESFFFQYTDDKLRYITPLAREYLAYLTLSNILINLMLDGI